MAIKYVTGDDGNRLTRPGDAPVSDREPQWGVIIMCGSESDQVALLERMISEGRTVRALVT